MALQKTLTLQAGALVPGSLFSSEQYTLQGTARLKAALPIEAAYLVVTDVTISNRPEAKRLQYAVVAFADDTRAVELQRYGTFETELDVGPEAEDPLAQAYTHAKTLPEFDGATDC